MIDGYGSARSVAGPSLPQTKIYAPVGHCIYCGSREWSPGCNRKLGDEHIVPEGLGGKLILPESSCKSCEKITSKFELEWLRSSFFAVRVQKGLGKKKKRSTRYLPLHIERNGRTIIKNIPIEKYPPIIVTMLFDHPGMLLDIQPTGKELSGGVEIGTLATFGGMVSEHLAEGAVSFAPQRRSATSLELGRILAKIAHSYAVAKLGVGGFTPFLQPIIMGNDTQNAGHYIGGTREIPEKIAEFY
ncbi:HNH endonuclease [Acidithiobacillus ferriphilus]|nr:HNH endonuclease [Acidithiobacillus ferriphilus]MBU2828948.1 hypothetical protein [Acidithiobacillus ferriphilus]